MDYNDKLKLAKEALDSGSYDKETIEYIFPELKGSTESEDERIMKEIKAFIRSRGSQITQSKTDAWIAWLEKQGSNKLEKYINDERNKKDFYCAGKEMSWNEMPLAVRKNDYPYYFKGDLDCYPFNVEKQELKKIIDEKQIKKNLQDNSFRRMFEQKPALSDEEKEAINSSIAHFKRELANVKTGRILCEMYARHIRVLKSLKERTQPQSIWKPTDEQIEALETYLYNPQYISNSEDKRLTLVESLYEQLKKLKS